MKDETINKIVKTKTTCSRSLPGAFLESHDRPQHMEVPGLSSSNFLLLSELFADHFVIAHV